METNIAFEEWAEIFWVHELATILGNGEMTKFPGKKNKIRKFVKLWRTVGQSNQECKETSESNV